MYIRHFIVALVVTLPLALWASPKGSENATKSSHNEAELDSIHNAKNSDATIKFYEKLKKRSEKRGFTRWLYRAFFVSPNKDTLTDLNVVDESKFFKQYDGKVIANIHTRRGQVFNEGGNWLERLANSTHFLTRDKVVRRDLLMHVGDTVDADLVVRNKYLMRSRSYIYDADIRFKPSAIDSSMVDMYIYTRDNWSLSADFESSVKGNSSFEIYDANILGFGNKLNIQTNFNWAKAKYGGNLVKYEIPNIMGSFFKGKFVAGKNFDDEKYGLEVTKNFIKPTDYEVGSEYYFLQEPYYMLYQDSTINVRLQTFDVWAGYSKYIPKIKSSLYFTALYGYRAYEKRPEVNVNLNPYFHNRKFILTSLGLYREKYYAAKLIYGYGFKEYLPAGYKLEFQTGYNWGEFENTTYLGAQYRQGGFTSIGYLMGGVKVGGSVNLCNGDWSRNVVDFTLRYISNLAGNNNHVIKVRQFATLNYTHGWNRGEGSDEIITFTKESGPRGFAEYVTGSNRLVLNTETVLFTPLQPLGCRMAFFAFADVGMLGYENNPFDNEFFSTVGCGIRMKNERLVFSTLELRLGFGFGKRGLVNSDYITINSMRKVDQFRYLPTKPESMLFK